IDGMATIEQDDNGQVTVNFNDEFSTAVGPDVHVFLCNSFTAPNSSNTDKLEIGSLQSTSGAQTYVVPAGVSIDQYNWVLIHCITYNHFWGGGEFGIVEGNCTATAVNEPAVENKVSFFYSNGILMAQHLPENTVTLSAYNLQGRQLLTTSFLKGESPSTLSLHIAPENEIIIIHILTTDNELAFKLLTNRQ
ncbi:MAG: DM13 domain-containing protein, partial [Chitinophagales bacterium]